MSKKNCSPSSRIRLYLLAFILIFTTISCQLFSSEAHNFDDPAFSFDYPPGWQTMEELWGFNSLEDNYYGLSLQKIIMVTSVQKKGKFGAYFAVASSILPEGESLDTVFHRTYSQIEDELRAVSETTTTINGIPALGMNYERPWGDPWWQFRDVWLEKDGIIYLLSFHCLGTSERYQEDLDLILNSFTLK